MSKLEEEFKDFVEKARTAIDVELNKAKAAIVEAVYLSEKYGIPFTINLGITRQDYEPKSFKKLRNSKKYKKLFEDSEVVDELQVYGNAYDAGWTNSSATC